MAGTEYFGQTAIQPRDHIPVNTMRKSHITHLSGTDKDYPQPRIIFSRLTSAKYHRITPKNSAYCQINTSGLFSNTRLNQVLGCRVTRSADHLSMES